MKFHPTVWSRPCIWLLAVVASLATTAPVAAQQLAILGLSSKYGDDEPAAALTDALRAEAASNSELQRADVQLSDANALLSQLVVLHDCEIADAACRTRIARQLDVQELIYGTIRPGTFGYVVELHRYSTIDESLSHVRRELTIEGTSKTELASGARELLRELWPSDPRQEPEPAPERPRATKAPAPYTPEPKVEASSNDWLGFALLGVSALSIGLTVYSWNEVESAKSDVNFRAYREAVGRANTGGIDDVCAEADAGETYGLGDRLNSVRSACGRGKTFEILQWVFIGSALLSAGFGLYVLLDDDGAPDAARASLTPVLGRDDAGLVLRVQM